MASEPLYPIRDVSRLTGINPVTLRAWQRRYGLLKPARTEKGHRLYSDDDIALIRQILHWVDQGVSIGQVKGLLAEPTPVASGSNWEQARERLMTAAQQLNLGRLEAELLELTSLYPAELVLRRVVEPWLLALARLQRPDAQLIEQSALALLKRLLHQLLTIKTGPVIAVARVGQVRDQQAVLTQFELQGLECRSLDLGVLDPLTLPLAEGRLKFDALVVILGPGLSQSWFNDMDSVFPQHCFFTGELGTLYRQQGWLNRPFAVTVSEIARNHDASFSLVQN
ncbi:MerR family transcriptional regulator [Oceanisphaera arctica]|uniref:Helix-turn-helix-type transcriptional regulator n=1 Tax=Oceanisphaera arctica TaxID=641510 RepID=A0A2P5TRN6_9GAMM|nr:MerR family transcriptional regulator [Oceanisphaera arctica]PPL18495.1 helix-turn-helix-type transcriptional regulator [Oceanisphaera arctica]GHA16873.1 MerR family transcriptional regulator [Oceanisphaera arctica]